MQGRLYRNVKNRNSYKKYEEKKKIYKYLLHQHEIIVPNYAIESISRQQHLIPKISSPSSIRNICFLTTKARSTYRDFRLNRNMIKLLASKKLLQGIKRSS